MPRFHLIERSILHDLKEHLPSDRVWVEVLVLMSIFRPNIWCYYRSLALRSSLLIVHHRCRIKSLGWVLKFMMSTLRALPRAWSHRTYLKIRNPQRLFCEAAEAEALIHSCDSQGDGSIEGSSQADILSRHYNRT